MITKPILIKNGRVIDPSQGLDRVVNLMIAEGKIVWRGATDTIPPYSEYEVINASKEVVCPGFIDLHCHLRQPGFEEKETIATGTQAAAKGGFTTVCCMPNTRPPLDSKKIISYVKSIIKKEGMIQVLPIGCITKSREGKELTRMKELAEAGVIAFSDDGDPVTDDKLMKEALICSYGLPVIDHCENRQLVVGGQINEGKMSRKLGLKGIPAAAEEMMVERDIEIARQTDGRLHIAHVSTAGSIALISKAKAAGIKITAEVTPHHLTLTEETVSGYNTNAKVNPPLRTKQDIESLIEGLKDNTIDAIATDHAPHTTADKNCDFTKAAFGITGFETALGSLMSLVHSGKLPLNTFIAKLTVGPAKIIGDKFRSLGTLAIGNSADIIIFNPELTWVVDINKLLSKGKNTPLGGTTLRGKVTATIYQGKIVYQDEEIK